jgi:putative oxygen-independent coproporphyrinogen III oxidase
MLSQSLYIHIPWCIRKCPYCDFNSHKSPEQIPEELYINRLIEDFEHDLANFPLHALNSIFIGGGTPSLLSAQAYDKLFNALSRHTTFPQNLEITLEANPGTVDQQRFYDYHAIGINRLSLGIQSFNAAHLKKLGRIHDDQQAHNAIKIARQAGFDNLNLDIMYSLPNQSIHEGLLDLQTALNYAPEHFSWYQLTIEPNTVFYKQKPPLPSDDETAKLEELGTKILQQHNYTRYEISAYSQTNKQSQHNLNYWLFGDYYGIGAGAHGKLTLDNKIYRTQKHRQPKDYLNPEKTLCNIIQVPQEDLIIEFIINTTRLEQPIHNELFTQRTGLNFELLKPKLITAANQGLLSLSPTHWQITPLGRQYTNNLQEMFL